MTYTTKLALLMISLIVLPYVHGADSDYDGINDLIDQCPSTSLFSSADTKGCPAEVIISKMCKHGDEQVLYWSCSSTKPWYCNGQGMAQRCDLCGCPQSMSCDRQTGQCQAITQTSERFIQEPQGGQENNIQESTQGSVSEIINAGIQQTNSQQSQTTNTNGSQPSQETTQTTQTQHGSTSTQTSPAQIPQSPLEDCPFFSNDKTTCEAKGCLWDTGGRDECVSACNDITLQDCPGYPRCKIGRPFLFQRCMQRPLCEDEGTLVRILQNNRLAEFTDGCRDQGVLSFYGCQGDAKTESHQTCPYGCRNGACRPACSSLSASSCDLGYCEVERRWWLLRDRCVPQIKEAACQDSDSDDPLRVGRVYWSATQHGQALFDERVDQCASSETLKEYTCDSDHNIIETQSSCEYGCREGACRPPCSTLGASSCDISYCEVEKRWWLLRDRCVPKVLGVTCQDADADDSSTQGNVYWSAVQHNNTLNAHRQDECVNEEKVTEYLCDDDKNIAQMQKSCPYGCRNGACRPACSSLSASSCDLGYCEVERRWWLLRDRCVPQIKEAACQDNDGPDTFTYGSVSWSATQHGTPISKQYFDNCSQSSRVKEFTCDADSNIVSAEQSCPHGCAAGRCNPLCQSLSSRDCSSYNYCQIEDRFWFLPDRCVLKPTRTECMDSDDLDLLIPGQVQWKSYQDSILSESKQFSDECVIEGGREKVKEYVCDASNVVSSSTVICEEGCQAGSCVQRTCQDPDGGVNVNASATTVSTLLRMGNLTGWNYTDGCVGNTVNEYSCTDIKEAILSTVVCTKGCAQGTCIQRQCIESDGNDILAEGKTSVMTTINMVTAQEDHFDSCAGNVLKEFFCQDDLASERDVVCPIGCQRGACRERLCTETDGSKNYFVQGTATVSTMVNGALTSTSRLDVCQNAHTLIEQWCDENFTRNEERYTCPFGCSAGACFGNACSDSEPFRDPIIRGEVNVTYVENSTLKTALYLDTCQNATSVEDFYCFGAELKKESYICPYGCGEGICLPQADEALPQEPSEPGSV